MPSPESDRTSAGAACVADGDGTVTVRTSSLWPPPHAESVHIDTAMAVAVTDRLKLAPQGSRPYSLCLPTLCRAADSGLQRSRSETLGSDAHRALRELGHVRDVGQGANHAAPHPGIAMPTLAHAFLAVMAAGASLFQSGGFRPPNTNDGSGKCGNP